MFLVVAGVFESWRLPAVVMLSVPAAFIGVASAYLLLNASFGEGAFLGVVLLAGIAANDSILLVDRYRRLRSSRPAARSAVLACLAVRQRLRPMWATTLTSIAGLLPLFPSAAAGNFWIGLATTVIGGLLGSTLLAPLVTVALLAVTTHRSAKKA